MPYLHDFCQGSVEWQQANFAGIVCDETGDSNEINTSIQKLAEQVITFLKSEYCQPQTFLGVGGSKIFRDDIWGKLRHVFQADYRYYKKTGAFNFPHRRLKSRFNNFVLMLLTRIPGFREEFYSRIKTEMYKPHKNIMDNCEVRSSL